MLPPLGGCRRCMRRGWSRLWCPDEADVVTDVAHLRPDGRYFRRARPSRADPCAAGRAMLRGSTRSTRWRGATGLPRRRHRRRPLRSARQAHAPGRRHRDPRECTIDELGFRRERFADRHLKSPGGDGAPLRGLSRCDPRRAPTSPSAAPSRCASSGYQYPDEIVMAGRTPQEALERLTADARWPRCSRTACPRRYRELLEHELRLVEQLGLCALFPDRQFDRRSLPAARRSSARAAARPPIR